MNLLENAYDLHVHTAPDITGRRLDDFDMAERARSAGMKGFAIKCHQFQSGGRAALVRRQYPEINAVGGITLNNSVGGLNPMAVEMAVYGLVSGLLYARRPKNLGGIYTALISAMAAGRLAWGAVMVILTMGSGNAFTLAAFWAGAVANAIPGIILQLAAVPALVMAVQHVRQPVPQEG